MLMLAMAMLFFLKFTYSQTDSSGYYDSIPKTDPAVVMDSQLATGVYQVIIESNGNIVPKTRWL